MIWSNKSTDLFFGSTVPSYIKSPPWFTHDISISLVYKLIHLTPSSLCLITSFEYPPFFSTIYTDMARVTRALFFIALLLCSTIASAARPEPAFSAVATNPEKTQLGVS